MGGEAQLTVMVLKVDLGCTKCCRKIKKVLCSTPQVRDQLFDDKSNTVTCTVICCTPEKIADKISRKAGGTVKGIEIKPSQPQLPAKPPADKPKEGGPPPPQADKPKQGPPLPSPDDKPKSAPPPADKPKSAPPPADKPKSAPPPAEKPKSDDKPKAAAAPPPTEKPKEPKPQPQPQKVAPNGGEPKKTEKGPPPQQQQMPMGQAPQQQMPMGPPPQMAMRPNQPAAFMSPEFIPVAGYPSIFPPVVYYGGGPYYQNQGPAVFPQQPVYQYDGYQGRPVGDYYGGGRGDDNPTTCSVM